MKSARVLAELRSWGICRSSLEWQELQFLQCFCWLGFGIVIWWWICVVFCYGNGSANSFSNVCVRRSGISVYAVVLRSGAYVLVENCCGYLFGGICLLSWWWQILWSASWHCLVKLVWRRGLGGASCFGFWKLVKELWWFAGFIWISCLMFIGWNSCIFIICS